MFENNKDTKLLLHSLIAAAKLYGGCLYNQENTANALNIVTNSVKTILSLNLDNITDENEIIKIQLNINQRLHAAVFFTALSSHGIKSKAANTFYGSISCNWPMIDFKFYIELNFKNQWSEYFIKCASHLPTEVLINLLNSILNIPFSKQVKYYSWHLILQIVILKLLKRAVDDEIEYSFNFDFSIMSTTSVENNSADVSIQNETITDTSKPLCDENNDCISAFDTVFNTLLNSLGSIVQNSQDISLGKILLNSVKTLIKYKAFCNEKFIKIFMLLTDWLGVSTNVETLKKALNIYTYKFVNHLYATSAWDISENYLLLIIDSYYSALSLEEILNFKTVLESSGAANFFPKILQDLNPFSKNKICSLNEEDFKLLYSIIQHKYEAAPFVVRILISNPALLQKDSTLKILEENSNIINVIDIYPLLLENILKIECQYKVRLLKLFYQILPEKSVKIYNDVLKYILLSFGFTDEFQLPNYEDQLSLFIRKASSVKEVENILPILFLQSPNKTLTCVIDEVLNQGPDGKPMIQTLKYVTEVCTYQKTCKDITPLIKILKDHLDNDELQAYESKNFATLFQFLMEVHVEVSILLVNQFIEKCIIPCFESSNKTELILQCLCVMVKKLIDKEALLNEKYYSNAAGFENKQFEISSMNLKCLISTFAQRINTCIETGCGKTKELLISSLSILEEYQIHSRILNDDDKIELQKYFVSLNEVVQVYGREFLPSISEYNNLSTLWIWACQTNKITSFEEKCEINSLTLLDLLNVLVQLIPHFTFDEWQFSVVLVKVACKNFSLRENIIQLSEMPFQLSENEKNLFAVICCFITSMHFSLQDKTTEPLHACTCFCNNLKKLLEDEALTSDMILAVFLEICYFLNCIDPNFISIFSSILFNLKGTLLSSDKCSDIDYQALISHAVKCLPDSPEKIILSQKLEIFV